MRPSLYSLFALGLFAACSARGGSTQPSQSCVAPVRDCAYLLATFRSNNTGVQAECDATAGVLTVRSTGVPAYTSNQSTGNAIVNQGWVLRLPVRPQCSLATFATSGLTTELGLMIDGVPFYSSRDSAGRDVPATERSTFDPCAGHADGACAYHYHAEPQCVFGQGNPSALHPDTDGHPPVVGYALDGFALHASYPSGAPPSTEAALDECGGHVDATRPERGYHYHATPGAPYLVGCLRGIVAGQFTRGATGCSGVPDAGAPDASMPPPDGSMQPGDGGEVLAPCTTNTDCTASSCGANSMGCTCGPAPSGGRHCVPRCRTTADCLPTPMGALQCDPVMGFCHP